MSLDFGKRQEGHLAETPRATIDGNERRLSVGGSRGHARDDEVSHEDAVVKNTNVKNTGVRALEACARHQKGDGEAIGEIICLASFSAVWFG